MLPSFVFCHTGAGRYLMYPQAIVERYDPGLRRDGSNPWGGVHRMFHVKHVRTPNSQFPFTIPS